MYFRFLSFPLVLYLQRLLFNLSVMHQSKFLVCNKHAADPDPDPQEKPEPGRGNIYQSVVINSSKEMMSFSDFPPPAEFPNNMHHSEVLQYLRLYVQAFNLLKHIRFQVSGHQVCS